MRRALSVFAAIAASAVASAAMTPGEFFARDRANEWKRPIYAASPTYGALPKRVRPLKADRARVRNIVLAEARRRGVPVALADRLARQESGFNPRARSRQGAMGVMQIMPATWRGLKCTGDPWRV